MFMARVGDLFILPAPLMVIKPSFTVEADYGQAQEAVSKLAEMRDMG